MAFDLLLYHKLALLSLHDSNGTFEGNYHQYGLAGALLSDLLLLGKISVSADVKKQVSVKDSSPMGDQLLDEIVADIGSAKKPRSLEDWVGQIANRSKLPHEIAEQLCELGILAKDEKKVLWIFTRKIYPEVDCSYENLIRKQMADSMFNSEKPPQPEIAALIALAKHTNLLNSNFPKVELDQHSDRIDQIADGHLLAAEATKDAIVAVQNAIMVSTMVSTMAVTTAISASN